MFPLDELWALAPFLIIEKIGLGAALAATAGLLLCAVFATYADPHRL
jgi:hypothetical protein